VSNKAIWELHTKTAVDICDLQTLRNRYIVSLLKRNLTGNLNQEKWFITKTGIRQITAAAIVGFLRIRQHTTKLINRMPTDMEKLASYKGFKKKKSSQFGSSRNRLF
jgi:hypothetical protein